MRESCFVCFSWSSLGSMHFVLTRLFAALWEKMQGRVWMSESVAASEPWTYPMFSRALLLPFLSWEIPSVPVFKHFLMNLCHCLCSSEGTPPCLKCVDPSSQPRRYKLEPFCEACSQRVNYGEKPMEDVIPKALNQTLTWKRQWNGWEHSMKDGLGWERLS